MEETNSQKHPYCPYPPYSGAVAILDRCRNLDIRLWVEADRLRYDAPRGALDSSLKAEIVDRKRELIERLSVPSTPYETYETRWGPGLDDDSPPIVIPHDWRSFVAAWPHERWIRWRRLVDQVVAQEANPTVETIQAAELAMYNALT